MLKRNCLSAAQLCSQLLECFVKNQTKRSERRGVGRARERESARAFGSAPILAHTHSLTHSLTHSVASASLLCLRSLTMPSLSHGEQQEAAKLWLCSALQLTYIQYIQCNVVVSTASAFASLYVVVLVLALLPLSMLLLLLF